MEQRLKERLTSHWPHLGSIYGWPPSLILLLMIILADRSLLWLSSERLYQKLTETEADTANHGTEVRNAYGRARARIEGDEGYDNPKGKTTVSTNLDPSELTIIFISTLLYLIL